MVQMREKKIETMLINRNYCHFYYYLNLKCYKNKEKKNSNIYIRKDNNRLLDDVELNMFAIHLLLN